MGHAVETLLLEKPIGRELREHVHRVASRPVPAQARGTSAVPDAQPASVGA